MTLLFIFAVVPLTVAIVLARGEPVRTISCLGAMSVGCLIAIYSLFGFVRARFFGALR
ncbi:hypothetical protein [Methylobacterium komagatae]